MGIERRHAVEFWFEFASTYSYPAAERVEDEASRAGVVVHWRPFLLGPIFVAQGWSDSPFNLYPAKGRYMWRDLERLCASLGLAFQRPSRFPRNGLLAARLCTAAAAEPWLPSFVRGVYRANFADDREISEAEVLRPILAALDADADAWLERAVAPETKDALRARTEEAGRLGIFGAPSFVARGELFWGQDRLGDALAWARAPLPGVGPAAPPTG
ncbi:MAG: 2-hydroxychromene-2-carboxylate isomerase [Myxococcota bacterium]|nr:2-hydroxychromene-2-carboxylate isomerase [Myxococcota bacterium]